jgi:hypothetical protein
MTLPLFSDKILFHNIIFLSLNPIYGTSPVFRRFTSLLAGIHDDRIISKQKQTHYDEIPLHKQKAR